MYWLSKVQKPTYAWLLDFTQPEKKRHFCIGSCKLISRVGIYMMSPLSIKFKQIHIHN